MAVYSYTLRRTHRRNPRVPIREAGDPLIRSMTGLHLYHFFLSNCAQRVSLALAEKGLDFTPHAINLLAKVKYPRRLPQDQPCRPRARPGA